MQKRLRLYAAKLGIETRKVNWTSHRGAPDLLLLGPGERMGWIEVKRDEGSKLTPLQVREQDILREAGCWVETCYGDGDIAFTVGDYLLDASRVPGRSREAPCPAPRWAVRRPRPR